MRSSWLDNGARALPPPRPARTPRAAPPCVPPTARPAPSAPSRQWRATCRSCGRTACHVLNAAGVACPNYHEGSLGTDARCTTRRARASSPSCAPPSSSSPASSTAAASATSTATRRLALSSMCIAYLMPQEDPVRHPPHTIPGVDHTPRTAGPRRPPPSPCGCGYDEAFNLIKTVRGVANPNTGFICRLLEFGQRIGLPSNQKPMAPLRLYRMSPCCNPRRAPDRRAELVRARHALRLVLHVAPQGGADPQALYVWVGARAHEEYSKAAHAGRRSSRSLRARRRRGGGAAPSRPSFWEALGGAR